MASKPADSNAHANKAEKPKTIAAKKVGLSLTISDETLKEFDRIQEETIKAAEKDLKFSWR